MDPELLKKLAAETAAAVKAQVAEQMKAFEDKAKADAEIAAKTAAESAAKEIFEKARAARDAAPPAGIFVEAKTFRVGDHQTKGKGINFVRLVQARAVSQLTGKPVVEVLKSLGDEVVHKALGTGDFAGLGSTIRQEYASEFIELLRNQTIVRKAGARVLPMNGSLTFDRQTGAGSAGYGGSVDVIAPSGGPTTGQLTLSQKKLTALTAVPNDLIRSTAISAVEFIRDDLLQVMALKEDEKFLFGSGVQYEPKGLMGQLDASGKVIGDGQAGTVYAETIASVGAPTLAEIKAEINKAKKTLKKKNAPMRNLVWLMTPDTEVAILNVVGPGAEGFNSVEREMVERGTLGGIPYFVTNQIPTNLDTGNARTRIGLFDMSEVLIGDSMAVEVEVFPNGHYSSGGAVVSGISTDRTVIRAITQHDIGMRHTESGLVIKASSWGL